MQLTPVLVFGLLLAICASLDAADIPLSGQPVVVPTEDDEDILISEHNGRSNIMLQEGPGQSASSRVAGAQQSLTGQQQPGATGGQIIRSKRGRILKGMAMGALAGGTMAAVAG